MIKPLHQTLARNRWAIALLYLTMTVLYLGAFGSELIKIARFPEVWVAPIMALGSFVAGSTFLGGGAVAFPALTKALHIDPVSAKQFSLAIQSVGMTSASFYIWLRVPQLPYRFIGLCLLGALPGLGLSLGILENQISRDTLRLSFTLFLVCFLFMYLWTHRYHPKGVEDETFNHQRFQYSPASSIGMVGFGFLGGVLAGLIGSGADLMAFCLMALYFRLNIRLATQISVVVMAATSVFAVTLENTVFEGFNTGVFELWLLAAPVVLFGAPLGAVFCRKVSERHLLWFICGIVLLEVASTLWLIPISLAQAFLLALVFLGVQVLLYLLFIHSPFHLEKSSQ